MNKKAKINFLSTAAIFGAFFIFLSINLLSNNIFNGSRIDLTEEKLYTLSSDAKDVVRSLKEPVILKLFYSDQLGKQIPAFGLYSDRVKEILTELKNSSNGNIKIQFYNPEPFSDVEDKAVQYGLQGIPVDQSGEKVYFGMVGINSVDKEEAIPFLQPERENFLEYDITKLVYSLSHTKKRTIGLISSLPLNGGVYNPMTPNQPPSPAWLISDQIKQFFDVKTLDGSLDKIGKDIDLLMIVHPKNLDEQTVFAIDQYVLSGGKTIIFTDPHSEIDLATSARQMGGMAIGAIDSSSNLDKLYKNWGLEFKTNQVAGDLVAAEKVTVGQNQERPVDYPVWLSLNKKNISIDDPITGNISSLKMASVGSFSVKEKANITLEPLIYTSKEAMQIDVDKIKHSPDPKSLVKNFKSENKSLIIAARLHGKVKTAFPNGIPQKSAKDNSNKKDNDTSKSENKEKPQSSFLKQATKPVNVVVVGDVDFLNDIFWARVQNFFGQKVLYPTSNNANFVINAIDNLLGSNSLMQLRGRGLTSRPFTKIIDIKKQAEKKFYQKEEQLKAKLAETEEKLNNLQQGNAKGDDVILTAEQKQAISNFRSEVVKVRKQLRNVQLALRNDITALNQKLTFLNILAMPAIIAIIALILSFVRRKQRNHPKIETN